MRILGVDLGRRRIGLALSDETGLLARPWRTVAAGRTPAGSARAVVEALTSGGEEATGVAAAVVGLPRALGGEDTEMTAPARAFAEALARVASLDVHLQDERLSSHEADARLAVGERDWRKRKDRLDAAAAAVILQDYLDAAGPAVTAEQGR